jgi:hypothetical protein
MVVQTSDECCYDLLLSLSRRTKEVMQAAKLQEAIRSPLLM